MQSAIIHHRWSLGLLCLSGGFALAFCVLITPRAYGLSVNPLPGDVDDLYDQLEEITDDLGNAQCGGVAPKGSVVPHIADIAGLPGHNSNPLGDIKGGMGKRIKGQFGDEYTYPGNVIGLSTACTPYMKSVKPEWYPDFLDEEQACERPGPYFPGITPFLTDAPEGALKLVFAPPSKAPDILGEATAASQDPLGAGVAWTCDAIHADLNRRWRFKRYACTGNAPPDDVQDGDCWDKDTEPPPPPPDECAGPVEEPVEYFCCSRQRTDTQWGNSMVCDGTDEKSCRYTFAGDKDPLTGYVPIYESYVRRYAASCEREAVPEVPDDDHRRPAPKSELPFMPATCYGFYEEYDPRYTQTSAVDRSCVIGSWYPGLDFTAMAQTQVTEFAGADEALQSSSPKAHYGQNTQLAKDLDWVDPPSKDYVIGRPYKGNEEEQILDTRLAGGFSLLAKSDDLQEALKDDPLASLTVPDKFRTISYPQLSVDQPLSSGGLIRVTDDFVVAEAPGDRGVSRWWQEFGTNMNRLFAQPRVLLVLPVLQPYGLEGPAPLMRKQPDSAAAAAPSLRSVEVQLGAEEDLAGALAGLLERSLLLHLQEEPIPIVVPLINPQEVRDVKFAWCAWLAKRAENEAEDELEDPLKACDNPPQKLKEFFATLDSYLAYADDLRSMRAVLPAQLSKIMSVQTTAMAAAQTWYNDTLQQLKTYTEEREGVLALRGQWINLQREMQAVNDELNLPWCRSDRFTTPVYSLLDAGLSDQPWHPLRRIMPLTQRAGGGAASSDDGSNAPPDDPGGGGPADPVTPTTIVQHDDEGFPIFRTSLPKDFVIDLSLLPSPRPDVRIPVLKPVQVQLNIAGLMPPAVETENVVYPVLKAPPNLQPIRERILDIAPTLTVQPKLLPDSIQLPTIDVDTEVAAATLAEAEQIVQGMQRAYGMFWRSIVPQGQTTQDRRSNLRNAAGKQEDCVTRDNGLCVHAETDLLERMQRICARPDVLYPEDLQSLGLRRAPTVNGVTTCNPKDWTCADPARLIVEPSAGVQVSTGSVLPASTMSEASARSAASARSERSLNDVLRRQALELTVIQSSASSGASQPYGATLDDLLRSLRVERTQKIGPQTIAWPSSASSARSKSQ